MARKKFIGISFEPDVRTAFRIRALREPVTFSVYMETLLELSDNHRGEFADILEGKFKRRIDEVMK